MDKTEKIQNGYKNTKELVRYILSTDRFVELTFNSIFTTHLQNGSPCSLFAGYTVSDKISSQQSVFSDMGLYHINIPYLDPIAVHIEWYVIEIVIEFQFTCVGDVLYPISQ